MSEFVKYLLAAFLGAFITSQAMAGDADFTLINRTGHDIESVYVAPSRSTNWGSDRLGDRVLADGRSLLVEFSKGNRDCVYDIKVHWVGYGEADDSIWERIDLCLIHRITLRYNRRTNVTSADLE